MDHPYISIKVWEHHVYKDSRFFVLQKYPQEISGGSCMMDKNK